ncbi:hypothetical protein ABZ613_33585 [Streptomyces collinus]|uniref:hypothetical protein n=1 Tax=Streptomyces collinus TaxID=42684 RepID=UPI0033EA45C2
MGSTAVGAPRRTTRRAGVFLASSLALFCIQLDFFALNPFLAPAVMVACSGPIGAWLSGRMRATSVMALAGVVAGTGMIGLSWAWSW